VHLVRQNTRQSARLPAEKHLRNLKQLTFGGENAEAYFLRRRQTTHLPINARRPRLRSDLHDERRRLEREDDLQRRRPHDVFLLLPERESAFFTRQHISAISSVRRDPTSRKVTSGPCIRRSTSSPRSPTARSETTDKHAGYDAETTITLDGKKLVFTSMRDGDLDIYTMDADGKNVRRLTNELGYDGGPFWSYDGKQIVYRANHPQTDQQKADYTDC
jgi:hypothetical protein